MLIELNHNCKGDQNSKEMLKDYSFMAIVSAIKNF